MNKINLFTKLLIIPVSLLACGSDDSGNPMNSVEDNSVIDAQQSNTPADVQIETIIVQLPSGHERCQLQSGQPKHKTRRKVVYPEERCPSTERQPWKIM